MKRKLLTVAVAAATLAPLSSFAAGPTVYGRLDLSVERENRNVDQSYLAAGVDKFDTGRFLLRSNASRLGVKGDTQLFNNLKGIYQAEWGVQADTQGTSDFTGRNTFAGVQGDFGTVLLGRNDSPFKSSASAFDLFNDTQSDIQSYLGGEQRINNVIQYATPMINKSMQFNLALTEQEQYHQKATGARNTDSSDPSAPTAKSGLADVWSSSFTFTSGNYYGAVAYEKNMATGWGALGTIDPTANTTISSTQGIFTGSSPANATGVYARFNEWRAVGSVKVSDFSFGALYETGSSAETQTVGTFSDKIDVSGIVLNATYKLDNRNLFKVQLGESKTEIKQDENKLSSWTLGWDNKLADTVKVYTILSEIESKQKLVAGNSKGKQSNIAVGIQYNF